MNKLLFVAPVVMLACGAGAAWLLRDRLCDAPRPASDRADYDALVEQLGGDEPAIRDELNELLCTSSATFTREDRVKINALTRECLDVRALIQIAHSREFLNARGKGMAYHFVSSDHRDRLRVIAGDRPTPERVLAIRKALASVAEGFGVIRQPPDWSVKVQGGTPPPMPFLELLRDTHEQFPTSTLPELRANPRVPAFSGSDGELLVQLERFFNSPIAKAAFPPSRFGKLYQNGRIPPIPTMIVDEREKLGEAVVAEQRILLPEDERDPDSVQALNEVYARLERFLSAIANFDQHESDRK